MVTILAAGLVAFDLFHGCEGRSGYLSCSSRGTITGRVLAIWVIGLVVLLAYRGLTRVRTAPEISPADPLDSLKKLAELRDAGVISRDEFEQKKIDLLSRS